MFDSDTPRSPLWIAIGIRRTVAALQANLMRTLPLWPIDEEFRVEGHAAIRLDVELHHPTIDAFGIELRIDGAVERIGEIDAPSVAADLDHLRASIELAVLRTRMARARDDAADADLADEFCIERIGHVVLVQVAGPPARHVEEAVVHRKIDVGDERRHRAKTLEHRRQ